VVEVVLVLVALVEGFSDGVVVGLEDLERLEEFEQALDAEAEVALGARALQILHVHVHAAEVELLAVELELVDPVCADLVDPHVPHEVQVRGLQDAVHLKRLGLQSHLVVDQLDQQRDDLLVVAGCMHLGLAQVVVVLLQQVEDGLLQRLLQDALVLALYLAHHRLERILCVDRL